MTVRNCKNWGINVQGGQNLRTRAAIPQFVNGVHQTGAYLWPLTISGTSDLPLDTDYVDNVKIYDSTFVNNTTTPAGQHWSYGPIYFTGVTNLNISRILIDETLSGGFGIKGTWAKNLKISQCDCRMKPKVAGDADGFAIEAWYVSGGDIFDNKSNGGISIGIQYDVRIHHNRIVVPAGGGTGGYGIEFGGYRSVADYNYFENNGGISVGDADTVKVQHNVFRNAIGSIFVSTGDSPAGPKGVRNIDIDNNTVDGNRILYNEGAVSFRVMQVPALATLSNIRIRNNIITNSQQSVPWGGAISLNGINGACTFATGISNVAISNNLFYQNLPGDFTPNCGVPTTQQGNKFATNPLFVGGTTFPASYYRLSPTSPALAAGIFVGLPYNLAGPPDMGAYVQPAQGQRIEAEMAYSVAADVGTNSPVNMGDFTLASAGHGVKLYDAGDKARVHFNVYTEGNYRIFARVRSGDLTASTTYFQPISAYSFKLDGNPVSLSPDLTSISAFDPSGGGVYWGTMGSALIPLTAGPHSIEVSSGAWAMLDYIIVQ